MAIKNFHRYDKLADDHFASLRVKDVDNAQMELKMLLFMTWSPRPIFLSYLYFNSNLCIFIILYFLELISIVGICCFLQDMYF